MNKTGNSTKHDKTRQNKYVQSYMFATGMSDTETSTPPVESKRVQNKDKKDKHLDESQLATSG